MADEQIIISVQDGISPNIDKKLSAIEQKATSADAALVRLNATLAKIKPVSFKVLDGISPSINKKLLDLGKNSSLANANLKKLALTLSKIKAASNSQNFRLTDKISPVIVKKLEAITAAAKLARGALRELQMTLNHLSLSKAVTIQVRNQAPGQAPSGGIPGKAPGASAGLAVGARKLIPGALAAYAGYRGVSEVIQLTQAYTELQNKLKIVTDSEANLNTVTAKLFEVSNRARAPIEATATLFSRLDLAVKQYGMSQQETLQLTEVITKASTLSGLSVIEQAQSVRQLSQAFNKGKLDGDEFRTVMETMPILADAIAKKLGVARGELLKLAPQGKITGEIMAKAFLEANAAIDKPFKETTKTVNQALTVIKNNFIQVFGEIDKVLGITGGLAKALSGLGDWIKSNKDNIFELVGAMKRWYTQVFLMIGKVKDLIVTLARLFSDTTGIDFFKIITGTITLASKALAKFNDLLTKASGLVLKGAGIAQFLGSKNIPIVGDSPLFKQGDELFKGATAYKDLLKEIENSKKKYIELQKASTNEVYRANQAKSKTNTIDEKNLKLIESRKRQLEKVVELLKTQTRYMGQAPDTKAVNEYIDKLNAQLVGKKQSKLSSSEEKEIRGLISANITLLRVMESLDEVYNTAIGNSEKQKNTLIAAQYWLGKGVLSFEKYAQILKQVSDETMLAADPLASLRKEYQTQEALLSKRGMYLSAQTELQERLNEFEERGILLTGEQSTELATLIFNREKASQALSVETELTGKMIKSQEKLTALYRSQNLTLQEKKAGVSQVLGQETTVGTSFGNAEQATNYAQQMLLINDAVAKFNISSTEQAKIIENVNRQFAETALPSVFTEDFFTTSEERYKKYYQTINDLRAQNKISEIQQTKALVKVDGQRYGEKLQAAEGFFGNLATLTNSKSKAAFEIGRAAAIAQATVQGILAVQTALASTLGYPYNFALAAAVGVATAANIATIAQSPPPQGYAAGGYISGSERIINVNERGPEFVMNAEATSRFRPQLEAMNQGKSSGNVNVKIENYGVSKDFEVNQISPSEVRIIARDEIYRTAPDLVSRELVNPNSRISKSLSQNTQTMRKR